MTRVFLILGSGLVLLTSASAGSRHSQRHADGSEPDSAVIRIPGSLKKSPIEFTAGIGPSVIAKLDFEPEGRGSGQSVGERRALLIVRASKLGKTGGVETPQKFILLNPRILTGIGTPIPLEAEAILSRESGEMKSRIDVILPDSVAAWRRLKDWPDLQKGEGISTKTISRIDGVAESIRVSVLKIFDAGDLEEIQDQNLLQKYEKFTESLRSAADETRDFDVSRQIAIAVRGTREERLAWEQAWEENAPVLNPRYSEYSKSRTDANGSPPRPDSATQPKAVGGLDDSGATNTYQGLEELQKRYPTLTYKNTYQEARATVAVCEDGKAFASGTIIGRNLILTCAHAVARVGRGGHPPARNRDELSVKVGYEYPDDSDTPQESIAASIIYEGLFPEESVGDQLDFALLRADIELYNERHFEDAKRRLNGIFADKTMSNEDQMKEIKKAEFWPIEPLPLANFDYKEKADFDIAGHPMGNAKLVCSHGRILYPFHLEAADHDILREVEVKKGKTPREQDTLAQLFDHMYLPRTNPAGGTLWYRYTYPNNSPGIGVTCTTVAGNSGGGAVADSRIGRVADTSDPRCIIGILVEGQPGSPDPWPPGPQYHEILLPATAIIKQLDDHFTAELVGNNTGNSMGPAFPEKWYKYFNVVILEKDRNNKTVSRRH